MNLILSKNNIKILHMKLYKINMSYYEKQKHGNFYKLP